MEIHVTGGLPGLHPGRPTRDQRARKAASGFARPLANSGFSMPPSRVTAYLGPADVPKEGGRFDLPIALGLLLASGQVHGEAGGLEWLGELSLTGAIRPVRGALPRSPCGPGR